MKKTNLPDPEKMSDKEYESLQKIVDSLSFVSKGLKTLAICSCDQKTNVSGLTVKMAKTMAENGKKVLILHGRLQNPSADVKEIGLTHYLAGLCNPEEILHETNLAGISVIPAGAYAANPGLLVHTNELQTLIDANKDQFDWILIETAPITKQDTSAACFAACSDGVVFVIKDHATYGVHLQAAKKVIEKTSCPIIGCVVTDAKKTKAYA